MTISLQEHIERAMALTENRHAQPVIVKELLHYEILQALSNTDLADRLIFQGGTALRMCYQGNRLSEDLDFVCGAGDPEPLDLSQLEKILQSTMQNRYGLSFESGIEPNRQLSEAVGVKRWCFKIKLPWESQKQRINFEICNIPSLDYRPHVITSPYSHQQGLQGIVIMAESREEIYSDKLVALGLRDRLKARDVWDVQFLSTQNIRPNYDWVAQKVMHYGSTDDNYLDSIERAIERMSTPESQEAFCSEMSRFVDMKMARMFESRPAFAQAWLTHAVKDLRDLQNSYPQAMLNRDAALQDEDPAPR